MPSGDIDIFGTMSMCGRQYVGNIARYKIPDRRKYIFAR